jgi:dihydroorotase
MLSLAPGREIVVQVIDPEGRRAGPAVATMGRGGSLSLQAAEPGDPRAPIAFISPGWVDLHAHVYDGTTQISVHPDRVGLSHGVHTVVDAGSAGQATLAGLIDYVVPSADTTVLAWLNIGSHGLVHLKETADPSFIDVDATVAAASAARGFVRGIKVRSSGAIVGAMGLQPLQLGKLVARTCGLPLLVHIGEAPPAIDDVLDLLDEGDTVTHCFHGKTGFPWLAQGEPSAALRRALDRGVRLDVGHGAASFSSAVARSAIEAGFLPHTISTDIHVRNIGGPVFDIATVMTKLLYAGMPLESVVGAVTKGPRETLGLVEPWIADDGTVTHATIFELSDTAPSGRRYVDPDGTMTEPARHIVATAAVVGGRVWEGSTPGR